MKRAAPPDVDGLHALRNTLFAQVLRAHLICERSSRLRESAMWQLHRSRWLLRHLRQRSAALGSAHLAIRRPRLGESSFDSKADGGVVPTDERDLR